MSEIVSCRGCGAPMKFIISKKGKRIPVNVEEIVVQEGQGRIALVLENGSVVLNPPVGTRGYLSHFATCPDANQFKRGVK